MAYTRYYIYKKQISLDGGVTWNDLYPSEIVPSGTPIGTYDTLLECNGTEMYRWVKTDDVSCKEIPNLEEILYGKFYVYKRQVSYDSGSTWNDTGYEVTSGDPITVYDAKMHCERDAIYRWEYKDMCINQDKYNVKVKQFSLDSGATWEDESPLKAEYLYVGTYNASSCGYKIPYEDALGKCFYNYACCNDSSNAACFDSYNEGLGIVWVNGGSITSTMNLGAPSSGYNICGVTDYGMGKVKSAGNIDLTRLDGKAVKEVDGCNKISIGYGVTSIPNYGRLGTLEELIIPSTVSKIDDGAFNRGYLKRVVMLGTTPPEIGENTFPHSDILTIYVPPESVNKYKTASGWASYADYIVGFGSQKTPPSTYKAKITDVFGYDYYISCDGDSTLTSDNTNIYVYSGGLTTHQVSITPKTKIKEIEVGSCVTTLGAYSMGHSGEDCYSGYATFGNVSKVTIPNSVTTIDERAFQNCTMLSNITIPNSVTSIGYRAFMNCSILSAVTMPSGITTISGYMFMGDGNLKEINIPESVTVIEPYAFKNCNSLISIGSVGSGADIEIPSGVTTIGEGVFKSCLGIKNVNLHNDIKAIEKFAFANCDSLTDISIPSGVTTIGYGAFTDCSTLSAVTLPNTITSFGAYSFDGSNLPIEGGIRYADYYLAEVADKSLTSYTIKNGTKWIGERTFLFCKNATSISIPNGVTHIDEEAFLGCSALTNVNIPSSVISIGENAFSGCDSFSSDEHTLIYIDTYLKGTSNNTYGYYPIKNGTRFIGTSAFYGSNVGYVNLPNTVISIGGHAFYQCSRLKRLNSETDGIANIPSGITYIGDAAFASCSFTEVYIPSGITNIGNGTFGGCTSLSYIDIPNTVTSIGEWAFEGCESLRSIDIPSGVTSIGSEAFRYCYNLENIIIPSGVTYIGSDAFEGCRSITEIHIPSGVTYIGDGAFQGCSRITSITIPSGVTSIGSSTFYGCSSLSSVTIPNSITSIYGNAFAQCSSLTSVTMGSDIISIGRAAFFLCNNLEYIKIETITPPTLDREVFDYTNNCPIYVLAASVDAYKSAWSAYASRIQAIP